jgi:hypothetical protein
MTDNNNKTPNQSVCSGQSINKSINTKKPPNNYATKEPSIQEPTMKFHPFQPGKPSQRYGSYSKVKEQALLYIQSNFKADLEIPSNYQKARGAPHPSSQYDPEYEIQPSLEKAFLHPHPPASHFCQQNQVGFP